MAPYFASLSGYFSFFFAFTAPLLQSFFKRAAPSWSTPSRLTYSFFKIYCAEKLWISSALSNSSWVSWCYRMISNIFLLIEKVFKMDFSKALFSNGGKVKTLNPLIYHKRRHTLGFFEVVTTIIFPLGYFFWISDIFSLGIGSPFKDIKIQSPECT